MLSGTEAQAAVVCRNLLELLLETGYWKWDPAGDLCTKSDQFKCSSLVMPQKSYSYSSSVQDWILFRSLFPLPAFLLLLGLICGWSWQGTVILLSCGSVLFSPLCSRTALSMQAIPGGFVSVVLCSEKSQMFAWKRSLIYCWRLCSLYPQHSLKNYSLTVTNCLFSQRT